MDLSIKIVEYARNLSDKGYVNVSSTKNQKIKEDVAKI